MYDDAFKSIRANLYERTTSPLFGAFTISWLVWNFPFFLVVFSGMGAPEKIAFIQDELYGDLWPSVGFLILGPLITSLTFLFLYPFPAAWVYRFWRNRKKKLLEIRREIEEETPLTLEESRRIRQELSEGRRRQIEEVQKSEEEIEILNRMLEEKEGEISDLSKKVDELSSGIEAANGNKKERSSNLESTIENSILTSTYRLHFNPNKGRKFSKIMTFGLDGKILEGKNKNEHSWQITNSQLELLQEDGRVHSRFDYQPTTRIFTHTNDKDTLSIKGQFLVPEPELAQHNTQANAG